MSVAIKGKSRPKGGGKAITRGPKPAYVPVRRPLYQRRSFWYVVAGVAVVLSAIGIWYGIAQQRQRDEEAALRARLMRTASTYSADVESALANVGTVTPPVGFAAFGDFDAALTGVADGEGEPADLAETADTTAQAAKAAADEIDGIEVARLVAGKGFDRSFALYMINSRLRMVQGLRLYEQAALLAQDAAAAEADAAEVLLGRAKAVLDLARAVFADGYQDYVEAQSAAGIFRPAPGLGGQ